MTLAITFTTNTGAVVTITLEPCGTPAQVAQQILETQRAFGGIGWTSGTVPLGGYRFPLENEKDFDWAIIGAREYTNGDGEMVIYHDGHAYKRRELDAVESKKMTLPAAIKYSRGAKPTDPPERREKGDGEFVYVTLVIFRGKGSVKALARKGTANAQ